MYLTEDALATVYKSLVRCPVEYANRVWNPYWQGLLKDLEKVQMTATMLVIAVEHLPYRERLIKVTNN